MTLAPDKPRTSRNRRRGETFGLMTRLSGAAAVVIAVAVLFNVFIHKLERSPPIQPEYVAPPKVADSGPAAVSPARPAVQGIAGLDAKRPLIQAALDGFFKAATVEDKLVYSRHPDRVRPLMQAYYRQHPLRARSLSGLGSCQSVGEKGYRLGYIQAQFAQEAPVSIIVEEGEDGRFRADWESLVRYSEMAWADFLSQRPSDPMLMRLLASQISLPEDGGFEWLELISPDHEQPVNAYFDRKDPKFQPLIEQLQLGGWKKVPLTLRLCYSEPKLKADAACIVGVEGKGWLILN